METPTLLTEQQTIFCYLEFERDNFLTAKAADERAEHRNADLIRKRNEAAARIDELLDAYLDLPAEIPDYGSAV